VRLGLEASRRLFSGGKMSDLIEQLEDARKRIKELEDDLAAMKKWAFDSDETNDKLRESLKEAEAELAKIADFVEPHWRGAGAKLEAEWIIKWISNVGTELDQAETERDVLADHLARAQAELARFLRPLHSKTHE